MSQYLLTERALEDLSSIWNYTADTWTEEQADEYYHELIQSFKQIARKPIVGREYDSIFNGLKGLRVKRHIVFYRILEPQRVEITRILHGRMDLKQRIEE